MLAAYLKVLWIMITVMIVVCLGALLAVILLPDC